LLFAGFATIASFGGGCMNQSNTLATQLRAEWGVPQIWSALLFAGIIAAVIIGGIRRIGFVTSILAPSMALLYMAGALGVLVFNYDGIVPAIGTIFTHAFAPEPLVGGGVGSLLMTAMWGIRRGLFSNEAGQGSAPIAHATAKTKEPVREGLVASLGPFIDTLMICTMTGLTIVTTGVFKDRVVQPLDLSSIEAVSVPAATDDKLIELRAVRETAGSARIEVVRGRLRDATLVSMDAVVQNARFTDTAGRAWSGSLNLAPDGTLTVAGEGVAPRIQGEALLTGATLTARAFSQGMGPLGGLGSIIVTIAVVLFAVSTGISWSYYGDRSVEYLFGSGAIPIYRWVFVLAFFMGAILPLKAVWTFGDVALGLMTLPNLIAIFMLAGGVVQLTREYYSREHKPYW
jgi:AGCS family alanine or glycine:cation symporter